MLAIATVIAGLLPAQVLLATRVNEGGSNPNGPNQSDGIGLACRAGRFVVAWAEQAGTSSSTQDVYIASSVDAGESWSVPVRVDLGDAANASDAERPEVAITASGRILAIFEDNRAAAANGGSNEDLLFNRSIDGGLTWDPIARALNGPTAGAHLSTDVDRAALSVSGESFFVAWEEDYLGGAQGPEELWFTSSLDGGDTFATARIVSGNGMTDVDDPCLCSAGDEVLIAFAEDGAGGLDDVWVLFSDDAGQSFARSSVEQAVDGDVANTMVARDGSLVALIWNDADPATIGDEGLHAAISQDGGRSFGDELALTPTVEETLGAGLLDSAVAVSGDDIVVVHADDAQSILAGGPSGPDGGRIYAAVSHDRGASWEVEIPLAANLDGPLNQPLVVADAGRFVVSFETSDAGKNRIAHCLSLDGGASFSFGIEVPAAGADVDLEDTLEGCFLAIDGLSGATLTGYWDRPDDTNELFVAGQGAWPSLMRYCRSFSNSSGEEARIDVRGAPFLADGDLVLIVEGLPDTAGLFFGANQSVEVPFGHGLLCANGAVRVLGPPRRPSGGRVEHTLDMSGPGIDAGMRYFQYWFREPSLGGAAFGTSDALAVLFQ